MLPWLSDLKCLKIIEFNYVADLIDLPRMENSTSNMKIMKIMTELFEPDQFDSFYEKTDEFNHSFVSITFYPESEDSQKENLEYKYDRCSFEINISNSTDSDPLGEADDVHMSHVTLKKKRGDIKLKFQNLTEKLQEEKEEKAGENMPLEDFSSKSS